MPARTAYVTVAIAAALPCIALAGTAPLGDAWVYFEFPRHITLLAIILGILACFRRSLGWAVFVPFATAAISLTWGYCDEFRALQKLGMPQLLATEQAIIWDESVVRVAPWLIGGLYGVLAALAIRRGGSERRQIVPAGAWLAVVGAIAAAITVHIDNWLTLENLSQPGTFTAGGMWCDSRVLSLVLDLAAVAAGIALVAIGLRRPSPIPQAKVVSR